MSCGSNRKVLPILELFAVCSAFAGHVGAIEQDSPSLDLLLLLLLLLLVLFVSWQWPKTTLLAFAGKITVGCR